MVGQYRVFLLRC